MAPATSTEAILLFATSAITGFLALHSALALTTDKNSSRHTGIYTGVRTSASASSSRTLPRKGVPPLAPPVQHHAVSTTIPDAGSNAGQQFVHHLQDFRSDVFEVSEVVDKMTAKLLSRQEKAGSRAWAQMMDGVGSDGGWLSPAIATMRRQR